MSERVTMPALGESVTEGTVTRWLKNVGDTVEVDEPLLEVSTDKVDTEIPSPVAGTLEEILAEEDETVEVGADLAVIGDGSGGSDSADDSDSADQSDDSGSSDSSDSSDASDEEPQEGLQDANPDTGEDPSSEAGAQDSDGDADEQEAPQAGTSDSGDSEGETITMPALGESVTEGTVTRWLKSEGDHVEVDEPLLEVSTDKVDTEVPSPVAGTLTSILVAEDETVEVGGDLAVIGGSGSGSSEPSTDEESSSSDDSPAATDESDSDSDSDDTEPDQGEDLAAEQKRQDAAADQAKEAAESAESSPSGSDSGTSGEESAPQEKSSDDSTQKTQPSGSSSGSSSDVSAYVTPLVRKLAAQHNVDLSSLTGTGVGGRIRKQDVLAAAEEAKKASEAVPSQPEPSQSSESAPAAAATSPQSTPASGSASLEAVSAKRGSREKMSRLRKVIAKRMVESLQVSAQLTTVVEVDVTKVARLRARAKNDFLEREGVKLSFMPFFALAAIDALKLHPIVNASIDGEEIVYHAQENLGVAVDTEKGLIVPVIKDAGDLNIAGLARKIADLAERTRTNKITPDELGGGTFTLTNTGSRGALFDTPILNQPQVGILGTGSVVKRPVVVIDEDGGETIAIRSMVYLALSYDHRIVDGADAARFLGAIKARLEEGSFEV